MGTLSRLTQPQKDIGQQDRIWALAYGDLGMIKRVRRLPGGTYRLRSDGAVPCLELPSHIPNDLDYDWYRSEEHTSELQSLMRISYACFCLQKKTKQNTTQHSKPK